MADLFQEINEDLRKDQAKQLFRRYAVPGAVVLALLLLTVGGVQFYRHQQTQNAADFTRALYSALSADQDNASADEGFKASFDFTRDFDGRQSDLARMSLAADHMTNGDYEQARSHYQSLSSQTNLPVFEQTLARLMAVAAGIGQGESSALLLDELTPVMDSLSPFEGNTDALPDTFTPDEAQQLFPLAQILAVELLVSQGQTGKAIEILTQLSDSVITPAELRQLARELERMMGSAN